MLKPIVISLSPNVETDDIFLALRTLLSPHRWFDKNEVEKLEQDFARLFGNDYQAIAVNSGRSAQYLILKALGIEENINEVLIQAFTCIAVPNAVLWAGAKPLFADMNGSYNLDPEAVRKAVTPQTKAIVAQHTFGIPADLHALREIANEHNLPLIEDCTHSLGATFQGRPVGAWGDVAFFSFGRDKVLSSVFGGMILCENQQLAEEIRHRRDRLPLPPRGWVAQQLFHPVALSIITPLYNVIIGKALLVLFQKLHLLSKAVYEAEKVTRRPSVFPTQMPGGLAVLARHQLGKLTRFNEHRRQIAKLYYAAFKGLPIGLPANIDGSIWLRFPITHPDRDSLLAFARRRGILLGDWYNSPVVPTRDPSIAGYKDRSCPVAEEMAASVINLPTYPVLTENQARKVIDTVCEWLRINPKQ
jgi:perosamine synthetase